MIKVLLIEKSSIIYKGIDSLLVHFPEEFKLYKIKSMGEMQDLSDNFKPEVILYGGSDIPDMERWDEIRNIYSGFPAIPLIVYNEGTEYRSIIKHFREGVMGYIVKDEEVDELLSCIRQVLKGQKFLSYTALWTVISKTDYQSVNKTPILTARELQIASYVGSGMRTAQIAKHLGLHYSTVSNFKAQIYRKLNVTNSLDLADELKRNQIL
jgi:two-component system invasion response regulator UvrY